MVLFFKGKSEQILAVGCNQELAAEDIQKLEWLFSGATKTEKQQLGGFFVGPRKEMITPWSTNAVEITQNMGISGISRIEEFFGVADEKAV
jgi:phosphoribosylformylglycinamidine synthase